MVQLPSELKSSKEGIASPRVIDKKKKKKIKSDDEPEEEQTSSKKPKDKGKGKDKEETDDERPPSPRSPDKSERKAKEKPEEDEEDKEPKSKIKSSRAIQINTSSAAWRRATVGGEEEAMAAASLEESLSPKSPRTRAIGETTDEEKESTRC